MRRIWTVLLIAGLLGVFAFLARSAALRTSVTFDEPLHMTGAYTIKYLSDFRVNPEDPPLFARWAGLGLPEGALAPSKSDAKWPEMLDNPYAHWQFATTALFGNQSVFGQHRQMLAQVRGWMLAVAVFAGLATAILAWVVASGRAGEPANPIPAGAALVAVSMFSFEPTILGHSSLVKNDIFLTLSFALSAAALVAVGRRATAGAIIWLALAAAIGVATKFSGLLLGPSVTLALLARAIMPVPWVVLGKELTTRVRRMLAVAGIVTVCGLTSYAGIWAVYGFRYSASADSADKMSFQAEQNIGRINAAWSHYRSPKPTPAQIDAYPVPTAIRAMTWVGEHKLVPETYAKGFNYTYASTLVRWAFLCNQISFYGWWWYFPATLVFKLPLGTWGLIVLTAVLGVMGIRRFSWTKNWAFVALGIMVIYYFSTAMSGGMNIGIRHLLPLFPIGMAIIGATVIGAWDKKWVRALVILCLAGTAIETLSARGRYISFFNQPSLAYGAERLLGDSNLDWGQDLPLLAEWQKRNPSTNLGLIYFGPAMPEAYGIKYQALEGTEYSTRMIDPMTKALPGVIVVSTSHLQEVTLKKEERGHFDLFRRMQPREILGGTLFVYNWPPSRTDFSTRDWRLWAVEGNKTELVPTGIKPPPVPSP